MAIGKGDIRTRITLTPPANVVERAFRDAGVEFGDWRPAWPAAAGAMRQGVVRALQSRGQSLGHTWPRGNAEYLKRKSRDGLGGRQMIRKGRVIAQAMAGKPVGMTKRSVSVGFTGQKFVHMPALQFKRGYWVAGWDDQSKQGVLDALTAYVQQVFARVRAKVSA